ncbi:18241_t:CDS:2, partial [Funneliformis geosporum]
TTSEALDAFDKIFEYLKQDDNQGIVNKNTLKAMKNVRKSVYRIIFFSKRQMNLDLFVGSEESNKSNDTYSNLVETERNHEEDKYQLDQNILGHW